MSIALDINASGSIVGWAERREVGTRALLWEGDTFRDLGAPGLYNAARGINDAGHVVGHSSDGQTSQAFYWDGTQVGILTPLEGDGIEGYAMKINNAGQVVGSSRGRATLWDNGTPIDLNSFLDAASVQAGWRLVSASDINDSGWITGLSVNPNIFGPGNSVAFRLTPVAAIPEPAAFALALAGLLTLGAAARRRRGPQHSDAHHRFSASLWPEARHLRHIG